MVCMPLQEGAVSQRPGGEGWVQGKAGPICDTTSFAVTGDITVDKVHALPSIQEPPRFLVLDTFLGPKLTAVGLEKG